MHHFSTSAARWAAFHSFCPPIAGSQHTHRHPPLLSWGFVLLPLEAATRRHLSLAPWVLCRKEGTGGTKTPTFRTFRTI